MFICSSRAGVLRGDSPWVWLFEIWRSICGGAMGVVRHDRVLQIPYMRYGSPTGIASQSHIEP